MDATTPGGIRTHGRLLRRQLLYPAELRERAPRGRGDGRQNSNSAKGGIRAERPARCQPGRSAANFASSSGSSRFSEATRPSFTKQCFEVAVAQTLPDVLSKNS